MTEEEWNSSTELSKMINFAKPTKRKCLLYVVACKIYICKQLNELLSDAFIENDLYEAEHEYVSDSGQLVAEDRIRHYAILYAVEFSEVTISHLINDLEASSILPPLEATQWQAKLLRHLVRPFKE